MLKHFICYLRVADKVIDSSLLVDSRPLALKEKATSQDAFGNNFGNRAVEIHKPL
jgi:hypothetical protein